MGRPSKPWWWEARKRWATTLDGIRYCAPAGVGKRDRHAAWEWHRRLVEEARPVSAAGDQVADLCERYLEWDEGRVQTGGREERTHRIWGYKLTRLCRTMLEDGRKLGSVRAGEINPGHLDELVRAWANDGLSPGYRRELAGALKTVLAWACRPQGTRPALLGRSPLAGAALPPAPVVPERYATRDEAAAWLRWLWRQGLHEFALFQRTLVHTGARPGELASATWGDVRWPEAPGTPGQIVLASWKAARATGRARRVFLPGRLLRSLRRRLRTFGEDPRGRIWIAPRGRPWTSSNLATYTARLRDRAIAEGIPLLAEGPDRLVNYRWRHTAASSLLMAGVPAETVARLLGTSAVLISRTYGHILDDHLATTAERLAHRKTGSVVS